VVHHSIRRAAGVFAAALVALTPVVVSAQGLPDPKALMEKHNAAAGGRDAMDKHTSLKLTATMSIAAMGMDAQMEVYRAKPNKFVQKVVLGPMGEVVTGFDGTRGWSVNPMAGAQLIDGDAAKTLKAQADFFSNLQDAANYTDAQTLELTDFEGNKCYKVRLLRDGREGFEYFNAATGLLAGFSGSVDTPQGKVETTTVISDWIDAAGIKFPKSVEQRTPNGPAKITFTAVEFDKVDPATFDMPAAVKAMVKP
jgi:choline dehydrogenase-like flavoprotein